MSKSIMQSGKACYLTGAEDVPLHKHHIYGGANRAISESQGFWVWLVPELHNMSAISVHSDSDLDMRFKRACQAKYEETHTRAEFMRAIGKNYLD